MVQRNVKHCPRKKPKEHSGSGTSFRHRAPSDSAAEKHLTELKAKLRWNIDVGDGVAIVMSHHRNKW